MWTKLARLIAEKWSVTVETPSTRINSSLRGKGSDPTDCVGRESLGCRTSGPSHRHLWVGEIREVSVRRAPICMYCGTKQDIQNEDALCPGIDLTISISLGIAKRR